MSKPVVFISYSHKNKRLRERIETAIKSTGVEVDLWCDTKIKAGENWYEEIKIAMKKASLAILILTTDFLASDFIQKEEIPDLLKRREEEGMIIFPILAKPCAWDEHEWLTKMQIRPSGAEPVWPSRNTDYKLTKIAKEVKALLVNKEKGNGLSKIADKENSNTWQTFQNREDELRKLLDSLGTTGGERFFLLISGPQMGKTWLLNELEKRVEDNNLSWKVLRKNLRVSDADYVKDAHKLLASYFDGVNVSGDESQLTHDISRFLVKHDVQVLLLLDQAEFINDDTAKTLRQLLSQINEELEAEGRLHVDLAFIAASRLDIKPWKGVLPSPLFHVFVLTHFKKQVINRALGEMARNDGYKGVDKYQFLKMAQVLDDASEGLPALLTTYMEYIRSEVYMKKAVEVLCSPKLFDKIASPYVEKLLSVNNLTSASSERENEKIKTLLLKKILLKLSPYRWISESHLERILDEDSETKEFLNEISWDVRDLWNILSQTYLIRPSETIWYEMYPSIRRLLFRYYRRNEEQQRDAHEQAYTFLGEWWQEVYGTDRGLYIIENLWHFVENKRLSMGQPKDKGADILKHAQEILTGALQPNHNTIGDLAKYVTMRLEKDIEFQDSMAEINSKLFEDIMNIIDELGKKQEAQS